MPGKIEGQIVGYGAEGNLITDISLSELEQAPRDPSVTIRFDEHETMGLFTPEHGEPAFSLLALLAPSGVLELTIVGEDAKGMLGVGLGEKVTVQW